MAASVFPLSPADVPILAELQPPDWSDIRPRMQYFLSSDFCHPIKIIENGVIVGIGTTICNGDSAWLAHIIVRPDARGKGYGRLVAETLIERLDHSQISTIYLDATDMGFPLYQKLGFELETDYIHLRGERKQLNEELSKCIVPFSQKYHDPLLELDMQTSAEQRRKVLGQHLAQARLFVKNGEVLGAYFPSLFDKYIMASDQEAGCELLKLRMCEMEAAAFPSDNHAARDFLISSGLVVSKVSRRMRLGQKRDWKPEFIFNRVSGGLG